MIVRETEIADLFVIEYEPRSDERGSFARVFDCDVFSARGLAVQYPQHGVARNSRRGTLRGMHYQTAPYCESKVIHCIRGTVWDVILDVRRSSATYGRWAAFELSGANSMELYVGPGLAHGYVTLSDDAVLHYLISAPYAPGHSAGVHWLDEQAAIAWPLRDVVISDRDSALPPLAAAPDPFVVE